MMAKKMVRRNTFHTRNTKEKIQGSDVDFPLPGAPGDVKPSLWRPGEGQSMCFYVSGAPLGAKGTCFYVSGAPLGGKSRCFHVSGAPLGAKGTCFYLSGTPRGAKSTCFYVSGAPGGGRGKKHVLWATPTCFLGGTP